MAAGAYAIITDRSRLDFDLLHFSLATSYWSPGIKRKSFGRAESHALVFAIHYASEEGIEQQVGCARVLTDHVALFACVLDVFVLEAHRGQGLGRWLIETILARDDLRDVRTWLKAHGMTSGGASDPVKPIGVGRLMTA
jgi:GNAT superfamily N-acetyltransferase